MATITTNGRARKTWGSGVWLAGAGDITPDLRSPRGPMGALVNAIAKALLNALFVDESGGAPYGPDSEDIIGSFDVTRGDMVVHGVYLPGFDQLRLRPDMVENAIGSSNGRTPIALKKDRVEKFLKNHLNKLFSGTNVTNIETYFQGDTNNNYFHYNFAVDDDYELAFPNVDLAPTGMGGKFLFPKPAATNTSPFPWVQNWSITAQHHAPRLVVEKMNALSGEITRVDEIRWAEIFGPERDGPLWEAAFEHRENKDSETDTAFLAPRINLVYEVSMTLDAVPFITQGLKKWWEGVVDTVGPAEGVSDEDHELDIFIFDDAAVPLEGAEDDPAAAPLGEEQIQGTPAGGYADFALYTIKEGDTIFSICSDWNITGRWEIVVSHNNSKVEKPTNGMRDLVVETTPGDPPTFQVTLNPGEKIKIPDIPEAPTKYPAGYTPPVGEVQTACREPDPIGFDWLTAPTDTPLYIKEGFVTKIVVTEEKDTTNKTAASAAAVLTAARYLLEYFSKEINPQALIGQILELPPQPTGAGEGWYLDQRPESFLKVRVDIPCDWIDNQTTANPQSPDAPPSVQDPVMAVIAKEIIKVELNAENLPSRIEMAQVGLNKMADAIDAWGGTLLNLDLRGEASKLDKLNPRLNELLRLNDSRVPERYDLYYTPTYELIKVDASPEGHVIVGAPDPLKTLSNGMPKIKYQTPFNSRRSNVIIRYLEEMYMEVKAIGNDPNPDWMQFVNRYILDPPQIKPGSEPLPAGVSPPRPGPLTASRRPPANKGEGKDFYDSFVKKWDQYGPNLTLVQKLRQDKEMDSKELKAAINQTFKDFENYVGSSITACHNLRDQVEELGKGHPLQWEGARLKFFLRETCVFDVYDFITQMDLGTLINFIVACLAEHLPADLLCRKLMEAVCPEIDNILMVILNKLEWIDIDFIKRSIVKYVCLGHQYTGPDGGDCDDGRDGDRIHARPGQPGHCSLHPRRNFNSRGKVGGIMGSLMNMPVPRDPTDPQDTGGTMGDSSGPWPPAEEDLSLGHPCAWAVNSLMDGVFTYLMRQKERLFELVHWMFTNAPLLETTLANKDAPKHLWCGYANSMEEDKTAEWKGFLWIMGQNGMPACEAARQDFIRGFDDAPRDPNDRPQCEHPQECPAEGQPGHSPQCRAGDNTPGGTNRECLELQEGGAAGSESVEREMTPDELAAARRAQGGADLWDDPIRRVEIIAAALLGVTVTDGNLGKALEGGPPPKSADILGAISRAEEDIQRFIGEFKKETGIIIDSYFDILDYYVDLLSLPEIVRQFLKAEGAEEGKETWIICGLLEDYAKKHKMNPCRAIIDILMNLEFKGPPESQKYRNPDPITWPTFNWEKMKLPTTDLMGDWVLLLLGLIMELLCRALMELLFKPVMLTLINWCCPIKPEDFGGGNLNDLLDGAGLSRAKDLFNLATPEQASNLMDDISDVLTPYEIADLLNGFLDGEVAKILYNLTGFEPELIAGAFADLGKFMPDMFAPELEFMRDFGYKNAETYCDKDGMALRASLLGDDDDRATQEEREELLENIRKQRGDKFSDLIALKNKIDNNTLFDDIVPEHIINPCGPKARGAPSSLVPRDPPAMDYMNKKVINVMFEPVQMSFSSEIRSYAEKISRSVRVTEEKVIPVPPIQEKDSIIGTFLGLSTDVYESWEDPRLQQRLRGIPLPGTINLDGEMVQDVITQKTEIAPDLQGFLSNLGKIEFPADKTWKFRIPDIANVQVQYTPEGYDAPAGVNSGYVIKLFDREIFRSVGGADYEIPSDRFGQYIRGVFSGVINSTQKLDEVEEWAKDRHKYIFRDILDKIGRQTAGMPAYKALGGEEVLDFANLFIREEFDKLPFIPSRAPRCTDGKIPFDGMMALADLKKKIKDDYDASCPDDENSSSSDPFKAAAIRGVIRSMIRVFTIEFVMQTIFSYGEFDPHDFTDASDILEGLFYESANRKLTYLGGTFKENVLKECTLIIKHRRENDIERRTYLEEPGEEIDTEPYPDNFTHAQAFKWLAKEEYYETLKNLNIVFDAWMDTSERSIFGIKEQFLLKWLAPVDIPKFRSYDDFQEWEARFSELEPFIDLEEGQDLTDRSERILSTAFAEGANEAERRQILSSGGYTPEEIREMEKLKSEHYLEAINEIFVLEKERKDLLHENLHHSRVGTGYESTSDINTHIGEVEMTRAETVRERHRGWESLAEIYQGVIDGLRDRVSRLLEIRRELRAIKPDIKIISATQNINILAQFLDGDFALEQYVTTSFGPGGLDARITAMRVAGQPLSPELIAALDERPAHLKDDMVMNIKEFNDSVLSSENIRLSDFPEVSVGLRLMYIPPFLGLDETSEAPEEERLHNPFADLNIRGAGVDPATVNKEKAYEIRESVTQNRLAWKVKDEYYEQLQDWETVRDSGVFGGFAPPKPNVKDYMEDVEEEQTRTTVTNPIPLLKHEYELSVEEKERVSDTFYNPLTMRASWRSTLADGILFGEEFDTLFGDTGIFPLTRMLSLVTLANYAIISRAYGRTNRAFSGTKMALKILYMTLKDESDYGTSTTDPAGPMGGNAGIMEALENGEDMEFEWPEFNINMMDIIKQTPLAMLAGLVDIAEGIIDPPTVIGMDPEVRPWVCRSLPAKWNSLKEHILRCPDPGASQTEKDCVASGGYWNSDTESCQDEPPESAKLNYLTREECASVGGVWDVENAVRAADIDSETGEPYAGRYVADEEGAETYEGGVTEAGTQIDAETMVSICYEPGEDQGQAYICRVKRE